MGEKLSAKRAALRETSRKEKTLSTIISQDQIQVGKGNVPSQQRQKQQKYQSIPLSIKGYTRLGKRRRR